MFDFLKNRKYNYNERVASKRKSSLPAARFSFVKFKNASAFLQRDARHAMHDIFLLRISAILPEAISDAGLTPTTDTDLLLAT